MFCVYENVHYSQNVLLKTVMSSKPKYVVSKKRVYYFHAEFGVVSGGTWFELTELAP